ncbi:MAG: histidine--tRNA ligase [Fimbriimonas sp.]
MRFQAPRGTQDVLPSDSYKWLHLEATFRDLVSLYGYEEIRTPTFEDTELFTRTAGETSDIVTKQMYSFLDKGDRSITLKPEGTAPAIRALIQHNLCPPGTVTRLSYITPVFRYERPQKGRFREPHQFGLELVGSSAATADAEVIEVTVRFFEAAGVPDLFVLLNSIGREACRQGYSEAILRFTASFMADQPEEFRAKVNKNPLRFLDSKDEAIQVLLKELPPISEFWEEDTRARFDRVQKLLTAAEVPYRLAPEIVRGLDYYTETVFEVHSSYLGSQSALCGGGRYDNLIKELGGSDLPSVGVGIGVERTLMVVEEVGKNPQVPAPDVFIVAAGAEAFEACHAMARELRNGRLKTLMDLEPRSMKAQLRQADKAGVRFAAILGEDEMAKGVVQVRDLLKGEQHEVPSVGVVDWLKTR